MKITTEVSGQDMALVLMQNTSPVGETCHDNVSNTKLREAAEIVGSMINDIWRIYYQNKDRQEASAKESSDIAKETLLSIKETLENVSEDD